MTDPIVVRIVVGGLVVIILTGLGLAAFGPGGGDVFSDAVKIGLGALGGILARVGPPPSE